MSWLVLAAGVALSLYSVAMPAEVGGIANLALLNLKTNLMIGGAGLFVGGAVLSRR